MSSSIFNIPPGPKESRRKRFVSWFGNWFFPQYFVGSDFGEDRKLNAAIIIKRNRFTGELTVVSELRGDDSHE